LAEVTPSVSRFLEKPFDIDRLVREVTEVVTSRGRSGSEGRPEADAPR
jgi:DNA-binding NtrC family response regulator